MTFKFPIGECEEKQEILNAIDRHVKGLAINNISRFEIACKLLFAKPQQIVEEPAQEEGSEEEDKEMITFIFFLFQFLNSFAKFLN